MPEIILIHQKDYIRKKLIDDCVLNIDINKDYLMQLSDEELAEILVHLCPCSETSKYSKIFRSTLNFNLPKEQKYPELFDNKLLSKSEYDLVYDTYQREVVTLLNILQQEDASKPVLSSPFPCDRGNSLYCVLNSHTINSNTINSSSKKKSDLVYVYDTSDDIPEIFCFSLDNLLMLFAKDDDPINPNTGMEFDQEEVDRIKSSYGLQIKLLKRSIRG